MQAPFLASPSRSPATWRSAAYLLRPDFDALPEALANQEKGHVRGKVANG